ncbi:MAG: prepilin-type N-terminal cleavage/methylation domain-containing protein, partial [Planctomycetota bacterium]
MRAESRGGSRGFTLAELLVTLGIIVFLVAISVPTLGPLMRSTSVDRTASIIRGGLMAARGAAVARREAGICWIVSGSVWESGELSPVSAHSYTLDLTGDNAIIIDNKDSRFSADSAWKSYEKNDAYPPGSEDDNYYGAEGASGGATGTASWTFDIPSQEGLDGQIGQLTVEGWWPRWDSYTAGDTQWTISHAPTEDTDQTSTTKTVSQYGQGNEWETIGTFPFRCGGGDYTITLTNATGQYGRYIYADAVKISG